MYNTGEVKKFKMSDLHGKTLKIVASEGEDGLVIVAGYDVHDGNLYFLSTERKS